MTVDLVTMRAVAHGATLAPWDPRGELEVATIPARVVGTGDVRVSGRAADERICVDIGGIEREAPRTEKWVCL